MATHHDFVRLVEAFCAMVGLDQPERIVHGGPITVDGIVFSLVYSEEVDPELVFIYCDYGEVLPDQELDIYRALLQANLFLYTGRGPALTLSADSGRVVRADHRRMADLQPQELYATMVRIAAKAKAWREDPLAQAGPAAEGRV